MFDHNDQWQVESTFFSLKIQLKLEKKEKDKKRKHKINSRSLITTLLNSFFVRTMYYVKVTKKMINKLIWNAMIELVSVRPGRHYQRWGKFMVKIPNNRHRMDGRNDPCLKTTKNGILTSRC